MGGKYKKKLVIGKNKLFLTHHGTVRVCKLDRSGHVHFNETKEDYDSNDPDFEHAIFRKMELECSPEAETQDEYYRIEDIYYLYDEKSSFCLFLTKGGILYVTPASDFTVVNIIRPRLVTHGVTVWRMRNTPDDPLFLYVVSGKNHKENVYSLSAANIRAGKFLTVFYQFLTIKEWKLFRVAPTGLM